MVINLCPSPFSTLERGDRVDGSAVAMVAPLGSEMNGRRKCKDSLCKDPTVCSLAIGSDWKLEEATYAFSCL